MITQPYPSFHYPTEARQSMDVRDLAEVHPMNPSGWGLKEWAIIVGAAIPGGLWFIKKVLRPTCAFLINAINAPGAIAEMAKEMQKIRVAVAFNDRQAWVLMNQQRIMAWRTAPDGSCVDASEYMQVVLKRPLNQITGNAWRTFIAAEDHARIMAEWDACIDEQRDFEAVYGWVTSEGRTLTIRAKASRIIVAGKIEGWIGIAEFVHAFSE